MHLVTTYEDDILPFFLESLICYTVNKVNNSPCLFGLENLSKTILLKAFSSIFRRFLRKSVFMAKIKNSPLRAEFFLQMDNVGTKKIMSSMLK